MDPTLHCKKTGHHSNRAGRAGDGASDGAGDGAGDGAAAQEQTTVNVGREHRDGCAKLSETIDQWMILGLLTMNGS